MSKIAVPVDITFLCGYVTCVDRQTKDTSSILIFLAPPIGSPMFPLRVRESGISLGCVLTSLSVSISESLLSFFMLVFNSVASFFFHNSPSAFCKY